MFLNNKIKNLSFREQIPTFVIESEITGDNNMIRIVKVTSIGKYIETNPKVKDALEALQTKQAVCCRNV